MHVAKSSYDGLMKTVQNVKNINIMQNNLQQDGEIVESLSSYI